MIIPHLTRTDTHTQRSASESKLGKSNHNFILYISNYWQEMAISGRPWLPDFSPVH